MLRKLLKNCWYLLLVFCFLIQIHHSQTFRRVEDVVGLEILAENNGAAVADYDGDNDLDIFVVAKSPDNPDSFKTLSRLFRNNNDGSFTDVTEIAGFPDLFLTYSFKVQLFRNLRNGTFVNLTSISGFDDLNSCRNMGATWFDYDNDGDIDIFVTNSNDTSFLYENTLLNFDDITTTKNWFKLNLVDTTSNRNAIGAIARLNNPSTGIYILRINGRPTKVVINN